MIRVILTVEQLLKLLVEQRNVKKRLFKKRDFFLEHKKIRDEKYETLYVKTKNEKMHTTTLTKKHTRVCMQKKMNATKKRDCFYCFILKIYNHSPLSQIKIFLIE